MKLLFLYFSVALPLALAKAPLHTRDDIDVVPNNYIVALKAHMTATNVKSYYKSLAITNSKKPSGTGMRGITNTFDNVAYNAFHVECNAETLESIRNHPAVRHPLSHSTFRLLKILVFLTPRKG